MFAFVSVFAIAVDFVVVPTLINSGNAKYNEHDFMYNKSTNALINYNLLSCIIQYPMFYDITRRYEETFATKLPS